MNQFLNMVDGGRNQTYEWPLKANFEKIWPESQASLFSKPFWTFLLALAMCSLIGVVTITNFFSDGH